VEHVRPAQHGPPTQPVFMRRDRYVVGDLGAERLNAASMTLLEL
jgi:hypothetical protein